MLPNLRDHIKQFSPNARVSACIIENLDCPKNVNLFKTLPRRSIVVLRDYHHPERALLLHKNLMNARRCGHYVLIAGDVACAQKFRADGVHFPEYMMRRHGCSAARHVPSSMIVSAAAHSFTAVLRAQKSGAELVFLSPVFATHSHPTTRPLGLCRFAAYARRTFLPVLALGGVQQRHRQAIKNAGSAGLAGIILWK